MAEGLKLTAAEIIEVISTFTATEQAIPAVAASPGWYVVGAFKMRATMLVYLAGVVSVSHASLTLRARLFDLGELLPVAIQLSTQSLVDVYASSGEAELVGGHVYQMQIEVVGNAGEQYFGSMKSLTLAALNLDG